MSNTKNISTKEQLLEKVKVLHRNLSKVNKERKLIQELIIKYTKQIDNCDDILNKTNNQVFNYLKRDLDICSDYIQKHKRVHSRDMIQYLNKELKGQYTRWKGELDSNIFAGIMGCYLKNHLRWERVVYMGRKTTVYYI